MVARDRRSRGDIRRERRGGMIQSTLPAWPDSGGTRRPRSTPRGGVRSTRRRRTWSPSSRGSTPDSASRSTLRPGRASARGQGPGVRGSAPHRPALVSRRHLSLEVTPRGVRITDLGSTNGTLVGGVGIGEAYVRGGERVRLGDTALLIDRGDPSRAALSSDVRFGRMLGASAAMRGLYPLCARLAASDLSPMLIEGETGTGKEVVAEALPRGEPARARSRVRRLRLHRRAAQLGGVGALRPRARRAFPRGAGRGARRGVRGGPTGGPCSSTRSASSTPPSSRSSSGPSSAARSSASGRNSWTRVDVRIIAATRRDLDREVQARRFRDDLFFRLAVGRDELPPLRRRTGRRGAPRPPLLEDALGGADRSSPEGLLQRFEDYGWPGNVRELHNAVARVLALGEATLGEGTVLEQGIGAQAASATAPGRDVIDGVLDANLPLTPARDAVVREFERRYLERALARHGGNVVRAAEASGIARRYFQILRAEYMGCLRPRRRRADRPKGTGNPRPRRRWRRARASIVTSSCSRSPGAGWARSRSPTTRSSLARSRSRSC